VITVSPQEIVTIRNYLEEVKMPGLRKNLLKLYNDVEQKLKDNPASIKYHHNYPSGLYIHTLEVMEFALELYNIYIDKML
jgi:23S rRNA maturation-related 3'-5' exoribonuclease YhaM